MFLNFVPIFSIKNKRFKGTKRPVCIKCLTSMGEKAYILKENNKQNILTLIFIFVIQYYTILIII